MNTENINAYRISHLINIRLRDDVKVRVGEAKAGKLEKINDNLGKVYINENEKIRNSLLGANDYKIEVELID